MSIYDTLNDMQREAVYHTEGPLLILAGAGSGKTRVLTHRIAYLIEEKQVKPWNIMAITFTNKAAAEMRERVDKIVEFGAESIWVATFHSTCVRILRRHIELLGYETNFTIYDSDDQKTLMRRILKTLDLDPKMYKEKTMLSAISSAKNECISPQEMELNAGGDFKMKMVAKVYLEYQKQLKSNNALDFDDLLVKMVELLQNNPAILEQYQERFRYIMVDEYQDTNTVQFRFIELLARKYKNLCVVGDDDQSIYKFRGANITNILGFEQAFPGARVIKLEQNYRSSSNILDAANEVIANNRGRKAKRLWTDNGEGTPVKFHLFNSAYDEAEAVIRTVKEKTDDGERELSDCVVLYRTNAQSRLFEEKCIAFNVPYRMIGGVNFYQRQEIKDVLAYLKTIDNARDDLAVRRIINVPKRGIGQTTVERVQEYANYEGISFFQALEEAENIPSIGKAAGKLKAFVNQIMVFRAETEFVSIADLIRSVLEKTEYMKELDALEDDIAETKKENVQELISKAADFESGKDETTNLSEFLEEVALVADIDSLDESANRLTLMTLHGAKGLEFPEVFLCGMEDGLFPGYLSINSPDPTDLEEERRLCYVGITRAMKELTMTAAKMRTIRGETQYNRVSRFIDEIPREQLERMEAGSRPVSFGSASTPKASSGYDFGQGFGAFKSKNQETSGRTGNTISENVFELPKQNVYRGEQAPNTFSMGKTFTVKKEASLSYAAGDRVRHVKFGEGTVLNITDGKTDYEVEVSFDTAGTKRMFASFAKLVRI